PADSSLFVDDAARNISKTFAPLHCGFIKPHRARLDALEADRHGNALRHVWQADDICIPQHQQLS
ncbi:hypothetical protein LVS94_28960, partial [Pseudomonas aeruginosa]|uniref:hypothetical protein n=1 Tax=Pseudomonas aeruginosa TaxID=287 RepID=UPI002094E413